METNHSNITLSIITVNYNGLDDTRALINSLYKNLDIPFEIIVVDNHSSQNEGEILQKEYPNITVILSPENLGFAGGNNLGIRVATGKYLFLINNDAEIIDNSISSLLARFDTDNRIGAISPKIKFASGGNEIQFAGYTPLSKITLRNSLIGFNTPDNGQFDTNAETPFIHGAAVVIKKEIINTVGEMPECYFLYYEELDWSQRITEKGYRLWYDPICTVIHKESRSTGQESPLKIFYLTRNRLLFARRNRKGNTARLSLLYQILIAAPKNIIKFTIQGRKDLATATLKGIHSFITLDKNLFKC